MLRSRPATYRPVGFLDPDPATRNRTLHSVQVLGTPDDLVGVAGQLDIDLVVLALAPAYAELTQLGTSALVAVKQAAESAKDTETRRRALDLKTRIEAKQEPAIQIATARMATRSSKASPPQSTGWWNFGLRISLRALCR